jgi:TatD DNase family protein
MYSALIDIGVNLTHPRFDGDREAVMERASAAGVGMMIATGTSVEESRAAAELAATRPQNLRATAGVHPHHASEWNAASADELRRLAGMPAVVAIGETGLDFNRDFSPRPAQERAFAEQLQLAAELQLPVFLHQRDAAERFIGILLEFRDQLPAAVAHCFTDGIEVLRPLLDLDCHIGVTGWICDERRGGALRDCVAQIPEQRLLLETDAPFLTPRDLRPKPKGGRNEPAFLRHIRDTVARLRAEHPDAVAAATTANARRVFGPS